MPRIRRFTATNPASRTADPEIGTTFGDVFDEPDADGMDVTFISWRAGAVGPFPDPLPYEELFVVTRGTFTVRNEADEVSATAGEVLHLERGAAGEYYSAEGAELVAVTAPPYRRALREAGHGDDLDGLTEV